MPQRGEGVVESGLQRPPGLLHLAEQQPALDGGGQGGGESGGVGGGVDVPALAPAMADRGAGGVRVNGVAPGVVPTSGNADATDVIEAIGKATVAGRPVRPVDVAFAVRYLVSDDAAFVHGSSVDVDGGPVHARIA